jgi:hypothetical protein
LVRWPRQCLFGLPLGLGAGVPEHVLAIRRSSRPLLAARFTLFCILQPRRFPRYSVFDVLGSTLSSKEVKRLSEKSDGDREV